MALVIRPARKSDASDLMDFVCTIARTDSRSILTTLEEFQSLTLEKEEAWIASFENHPGKILLVAELAGKIVGMIDCAASPYKRRSHIAVFGMSVSNQVRRQGVGTALLQAVIAWAKANPQIEKLELNVYTENTGAHALYKKLGFQDEHISRKATKFATGDYADNIVMGLLLTP